MDSLILEDRHGKHYRLRLPGDVFFPFVSIEHQEFHDRLSARRFIQGLRYDTFRWHHVLHSVAGQREHLRDNEVLDAIASQIERGRIKVYPITHLTRSAPPAHCPAGEARGGIRYRFFPASMLLTNSLRDVRIFHNRADAEKFVRSLNWIEADSEVTSKTHGRTKASPASAHRDKTGDLIDQLAKGEVVVAKEADSAIPPTSATMETSASGPGNRLATLGPHVGDSSGVKPSANATDKPPNTFKDQEAAAKAALNKANPQSIQDNLEYGGLIFRDKMSGEYGYTGPVKGTDQGVNPFGAPIPPGTELVGDYHTHADYSVVDRNTGAAVRTSNSLKDDFNSDNFSPEDIRGIKAVGKNIRGYNGYLGTPSGIFKVYNPTTGMINPL
jgi:hypothetical protein